MKCECGFCGKDWPYFDECFDDLQEALNAISEKGWMIKTKMVETDEGNIKHEIVVLCPDCKYNLGE